MKWTGFSLWLSLCAVASAADGNLRATNKEESNEAAVLKELLNRKLKEKGLDIDLDSLLKEATEETPKQKQFGRRLQDPVDPSALQSIIDEQAAPPEQVSAIPPQVLPPPVPPIELPPPVPVPEPPARISGDPHLTMFNGRKYDFHGGCDLVFLHLPDYNTGQGMRIHARTKIRTWWSYVETAVVQIGNDTLEVMGGDVHDKRYWVNGEPGPYVKDSGLMPFTIGGHQVRFRVLRDDQWQFKIFLEGKQAIILRSVKEFMKIDIQHHTKETFGNSMGLLGTYEDGLMLARDGKRVMNDANQFGMEWQVHSDEPMLFHSVEGTQHPDSCAMPTDSQLSRRLEESKMSREEAEDICEDVSPIDLEDCIADVMATGDETMVGAF